MVTAGFIYRLLNDLNFTIDIREVCVFLAPFFSGATAVATYLLTSEVKDSSAGLLAAIFIGIAPGYISRSVAGSYDNEAIAIFLLMTTFYFWVKALKEGSAFFGGIAAMFYFWMVSAWGGYVFIINVIPLHVLALMIMGRFSSKVYVPYSTFYIIGTLASMQIPFVGFQPTSTSEHMGALGVFGLCQIFAFVELVRSHLPQKQFQVLLNAFLVFSFIASLAALVLLTMTGHIAPWTGRFYSLWDTGYAKKYIPIIASVSEHQPTPWTSWFFDLNWLIFLFPAGVYLCFKELKNEHVFVIIYALFASYFSSVMVRLMLTLTPIVCVGAAISLSSVLDTYLLEPKVAEEIEKEAESVSGSKEDLSAVDKEDKSKQNLKKRKGSDITEQKKLKKQNSTSGLSFIPKIMSVDARTSVVLAILYLSSLFVFHCTYVTSYAYSSPSVVLSSRNADGSQYIIDDFREAYYWLRMNTDKSAKVMSWWDYGYQIAGFADRATLVDNNTWNNTHIATVGKAMSSREEVSYPILKKHDVDYVLVIFGGMLGYSGDDINKFLWMIRIAQGVWPNEVVESKFFTPQGEYEVARPTDTMKNSLMYKMSYFRFGDLYGQGVGSDRVRGVQVNTKDINLDTLEEAFSSEHLIVRIYKVKPLDVLGRPLIKQSAGKKNRKRSK